MNVAQARTVEGTSYPDPIAYVVAGGYTEAEARAVINAYKAFYARNKGAKGSWMAYVIANTEVKDSVKAMGIMRRYRKFYGK